MKRLLLVAAVATSLAAPATAGAFHHGSIPARECAASATASDNPTAVAAIRDKNPVMTPGPTFPPFGTPGEGVGVSHVQCDNANRP
jgi:hypothetical protein